jgi:hypothetical protein
MMDEDDVVEVYVDDVGLDRLQPLIEKLRDTKEHVHFDDAMGRHVLFIHAETRLLMRASDAKPRP